MSDPNPIFPECNPATARSNSPPLIWPTSSPAATAPRSTWRSRPARARAPPILKTRSFSSSLTAASLTKKSPVDWLKAKGHNVADLSAINSMTEADKLVSATVAAMKQGADVIVQGGLRDRQWFGKPDILFPVSTRINLGDWSYEVYDTKISRRTKAGAVLQLGLYSQMVARVQGWASERFYVVTPRVVAGKMLPDEASRQKPCPDSMLVLEYHVNDYAAYFRLIVMQLAETVLRDPLAVATAHYPDPFSHCQICRWSAECDKKRHADDHISLVAGIGRMQRQRLLYVPCNRLMTEPCSGHVIL
jgi:predicted RecB family nuclease